MNEDQEPRSMAEICDQSLGFMLHVLRYILYYCLEISCTNGFRHMEIDTNQS